MSCTLHWLQPGGNASFAALGSSTHVCMHPPKKKCRSPRPARPLQQGAPAAAPGRPGQRRAPLHTRQLRDASPSAMHRRHCTCRLCCSWHQRCCCGQPQRRAAGYTALQPAGMQRRPLCLSLQHVTPSAAIDASPAAPAAAARPLAGSACEGARGCSDCAQAAPGGHPGQPAWGGRDPALALHGRQLPRCRAVSGHCHACGCFSHAPCPATVSNAQMLTGNMLQVCVCTVCSSVAAILHAPQAPALRPSVHVAAGRLAQGAADVGGRQRVGVHCTAGRAGAAGIGAG